MKTCGDAGGTKADGSPCGSTLGIQESGLCRLHDPACAEEVQEMRRAGGRASAEKKLKARAAEPDGCPRAPKTLEDAAAFASWLTRAVAVGELHPRVGHEAAYSLRAFQTMVEKRDLLREIEALRAELKAAQRPRPRVV